MTWKKTILLTAIAGVFILSLSGCGFLRKSAIKASREDIKNMKATIVVAKNLLKTWPVNSGFIRGALGNRMGELPVSALDAMDELDEYAERAKTEELCSEELGYSLGLRLRACSEVLIGALKQIAPGVLQALPFAL